MMLPYFIAATGTNILSTQIKSKLKNLKHQNNNQKPLPCHYFGGRHFSTLLYSWSEKNYSLCSVVDIDV